MAAEREELINKFATLTDVDGDLATYCLEQSGWNLEVAVDNFFESLATSSTSQGGRQNPIMVPDDTESPSDTAEFPYLPGFASHQDFQGRNQTLSVLSWNVDGLDERNLVERTRKVCYTINSRKPDVVFLQEVVPQSLTIFRSSCSWYSCLYGPTRAYFNIMLLKNTTIKMTDDLQWNFFQSSGMGRYVLCQSALFDGKIQLSLMTSHLESTAQCAAERKKQFQQILTTINDKPSQANVIFGGDTNLRDNEVKDVGGLPCGVLDAWEEIGRPEDAKYTWDVSANDNLDWQRRSKPKLRFDRLFIRPTEGPHKLKVNAFSLVGKERLSGCERFASDHWGIWCEFAESADS